MRRNKFGGVKTSRATQFFRGTTPALDAIHHVDDPLLAILPPPPIPLLAILPPPPIPPIAHIVYLELEEDDEDVEDEETHNTDWLTQHVNRLLVSRYYSKALGSPPRNLWHGQGGTISLIRKTFPSESCHKIKKVIQETYDLEQEGNKYTGERKEIKFKGAHLIEAGSVHERMVCGLIETGLGLAHTTLLLNQKVKDDNKEEVDINYVYEAYL